MRVRAPLEVWAEALAAGRLKLVSGFHTAPMTFQDSCNFVRNGGLFRQCRDILEVIATDLREMQPHGAATYCCGNGGGHALMGEYRARRLAASRAKAESMAATGAELVVVACHNCEGGILETIKHYELPLKMELFSEYVAAAADLSGWQG